MNLDAAFPKHEWGMKHEYGKTAQLRDAMTSCQD